MRNSATYTADAYIQDAPPCNSQPPETARNKLIWSITQMTISLPERLLQSSPLMLMIVVNFQTVAKRETNSANLDTATSFIDHFCPYTRRRDPSAGPISSAPSSRVSSMYPKCHTSRQGDCLAWDIRKPQLSTNCTHYLSIINHGNPYRIFSATIRDAQLNEDNQITGDSPSSRPSFSKTHLHPSGLRQKTAIWCVTSKAHPSSSVSQSHYEKDRTRCLNSPARRRKTRFATSRKLKKDASDWNIRITGLRGTKYRMNYIFKFDILSEPYNQLFTYDCFG
jgi:hypothetical protein